MTGHASHHKTTGKVSILYILIFIFLDGKMEDKRFWTEWWQPLSEFTLLFIT
jgi:hypothetical protein